jgi:hypothetical protein
LSESKEAAASMTKRSLNFARMITTTIGESWIAASKRKIAM